VAREIEFYVDTPFGIEAGAALDKVWALTCADFALSHSTGNSAPSTGGSAISATSARVVLEIVNHCHGKMKDELEGLIDKRATMPAPERTALIGLSFRRLDHLYKTNEALRCVIFERALAIRRAVSAESYWSTFFGVGQVNYVQATPTRACVG
jgi:hypothetical protein